ncbi:NlpC/P60 family protein [Halomonas sp. OfavH-34-E]|uniref:C40 family peptidase n=1 Tax=Halomonas sp. OfavH-34-E TaxID=2954491 RepID=UPI0034173636
MLDVSEYIGIPYLVGGRGPHLDCWGLVRLVYRQRLGVDLPSMNGYQETLNEQTSSLIEGGKCDWSPTDHPQPYDVVLFNISGMVNHIGLVIASGWMLHTTHGANSRREQYTRPLWKTRIEGFYRHDHYRCAAKPPVD